jgi:peroxiredoxin
MDEEGAARPTESTLERVRNEILQGTGAALLPIYERIQARLAKTGMGKTALRIGDRAPDFFLPDHQGNLVRSKDLLSQGPLVVRFCRGSWCPFSVAELRIFQAAAQEFDALQATLITLTPDTGMLLRDLKSELRLGLEILADVDSGVGLSFGVVFSVPPDARQALKAFGADLPTRHGNPIWMLPISSTFVIGCNGLVQDTVTDLDFTAIANPSVTLKKLRTLNGG